MKVPHCTWAVLREHVTVGVEGSKKRREDLNEIKHVFLPLYFCIRVKRSHKQVVCGSNVFTVPNFNI